MLKRSILLFGVILMVVACSTKPQFVINGKVVNGNDLDIKLIQRIGKEYVILDSTVIVGGEFLLNGKVEFPEVAYLEISGKEQKRIFYLENSIITIIADADSLQQAKVRGSGSENEYVKYNEMMKPFKTKENEIGEKYSAAQATNDEALMEELYNEYMQNDEKKNAVKKEYIKANPASFVTPGILRSVSMELKADELEEFVNLLAVNVKQTPIVKGLKERITALKSTAIGMKAPDFELNDPDGNPIKLSQVIGSKLLLLDFWAAWCGPCRRENPNVVAVYNEFKNQGFDVLGVSLDSEKDNWLQAIEDDKLTWTHVSALQYWDCPAAKKYAVMSIPANFLLDENGVIIAKNLREEALREKVAELLK